jgi:hypothetical protein
MLEERKNGEQREVRVSEFKGDVLRFREQRIVLNAQRLVK